MIVFGLFGVFALFVFGFVIFLKMKTTVLARSSQGAVAAVQSQNSGCFQKIAGPMFTLMGIGLFSVGILNIVKGSASNDWPTTRGEVLTSEVQSRLETSDSSSGSGSRRRRKTTTTTVYWAEMKYSYVVEGVSFEGARVDYGMESRSSKRTRADEIVALYPVGEEVLVYYDPSDPSEAVLEPGVGADAFLFPLIGVLFTLIGLVMLFFLFRAKR
jgi:hypothetical protein